MSAPAIADPAVDALKRLHRDTWADGDYAAVARHIAAVPPATVLGAVDVAGRELLDVATGTGNLALLAARSGATVTGLDLVEELLDVARARAAADELAVDWLQGDAEALPFPDASFDVVTSVFGVQFAPRSRVVADELLRVVRPGGSIVLVNWTPDGLIGELFATMGRYMPAPPPFVTPPPRWGDERHLRELFEPAADVRFAHAINPWDMGSVAELVELFERDYGPTKRAREKLTAEGTWDALRADMTALFARRNRARDGGLRIDGEFVVCVARRGG